jgi:hypothetical protein
MTSREVTSDEVFSQGDALVELVDDTHTFVAANKVGRDATERVIANQFPGKKVHTVWRDAGDGFLVPHGHRSRNGGGYRYAGCPRFPPGQRRRDDHVSRQGRAEGRAGVMTKKSAGRAGRMRCVVENDELVLYCEIKERGRFIPVAKRYSGKNWINLEPGYRVSGSEPGGDYSTICIEYDPTWDRPQ